MNNCQNCVKLRSINKETNTNTCKKTKVKIEEVRITCAADITETIAATAATACANGYINNLVASDDVGNPTPFIAVDVLNPDDLDEANEYAFDRTADEGDDQYNLTPLRVRAYDPEHQCVLDSMKGQDVLIAYKLENKSGDFVWRRMHAKLSGVTGALIAGYDLTFNADNPIDEEKPMFMNFSDAAATTTAMDALTDFGS